jgi:hypothetical protein
LPHAKFDHGKRFVAEFGEVAVVHLKVVHPFVDEAVFLGLKKLDQGTSVGLHVHRIFLALLVNVGQFGIGGGALNRRISPN